MADHTCSDDDNIIDIDPDDLSDDSKDEDILDISIEDLDDIDDAPRPEGAAGYYPSVDAKDLAAEKDAGLIRMAAVCSSVGQPFAVLWEQTAPGVYSVSRVEPLTEAEKTNAPGSGDMAVDGQFSLAEFPGCPHCGAMRMSVCEHCGTTICEGGVTTTFLGGATLICPVCGTRGRVEGTAGRVYGSGGGKGKGGKAKK
ncbi:MAG: hypothetical protein R6V19_04970 [Armatimonadota bacterium]